MRCDAMWRWGCRRCWRMPCRERAGTVRQAVCRLSWDGSGRARCSDRSSRASDVHQCTKYLSRRYLDSRQQTADSRRQTADPVQSKCCRWSRLNSTRRTRPRHISIWTGPILCTQYLYPPATTLRMCRPVPACCQSATHQTHAHTAIAPQRIAPRRSPLSAAALPRRHGMGWDGQRPRVSASRGDRDDALPAAVQQWASVYLGYLPTGAAANFNFPPVPAVLSRARCFGPLLSTARRTLQVSNNTWLVYV